MPPYSGEYLGSPRAIDLLNRRRDDLSSCALRGRIWRRLSGCSQSGLRLVLCDAGASRAEISELLECLKYVIVHAVWMFTQNVESSLGDLVHHPSRPLYQGGLHHVSERPTFPAVEDSCVLARKHLSPIRGSYTQFFSDRVADLATTGNGNLSGVERALGILLPRSVWRPAKQDSRRESCFLHCRRQARSPDLAPIDDPLPSIGSAAAALVWGTVTSTCGSGGSLVPRRRPLVLDCGRECH